MGACDVLHMRCLCGGLRALRSGRRSVAHQGRHDRQPPFPSYQILDVDRALLIAIISLVYTA